jgi:hypothetical protein
VAIAAALAAADQPDHAGAADAGDDLVTAERLELLGHRRRRAVHVVKKLRMGVQVMPPSRDLTMQIGDAIDDWHLTLTGVAAARSIPVRGP